MNTNKRKVDFKTSTIDPEKEFLEVKGCLAFEVVNRGTAELDIDATLNLKRFDRELFVPPIEGAVFVRNPRYEFSDEGVKDARLITWYELPEEPEYCDN